MAKDLLKYLTEHYSSFSKGHKAIADYIIQNYDTAAFMTAVKLGTAVGISESTVVRFAYEVGYDGYPKLQKALQEMVRNQLTSTQRIAITDETGGEAILHKVMNADAENIRGTLAGIDRETFERCVDEILNARNIYILGVRSSAALASFLSFYFNLMLPNVRLVSVNTVSEVYEQILRAEAGDVMIGISFPRYSKRTVKAMQYVRKQGARAIAITDSHTSPLAETADLALLAKSNMVSFVDSLAAPMSIINALIVAVGMRKKDDVYRSFEKLEQIWDEYEVYEKNG